MTVTIYHNPACGTSRNTLAMIRQSGEEPEVDRIFEQSAQPRAVDRTDWRDGNFRSRAAARKRHALCANSGLPIPNGPTTS